MDNNTTAKRRLDLSDRFLQLLSMSPRKKSKPNNKAAASADPEQAEPASSPAPSQQPDSAESSEPLHKTPSRTQTVDTANTASSAASINTTGTSPAQSQGKASGRKWYGGAGSWRSKAPPVAQIARASIASAAGTTSEVPTKKSAPDSPAKLLSKRRSSKGVPTASMTKLNVSSTNLGDKMTGAESTKEDEEPPKETEPVKEPEPDPPLPPEPTKTDAAEKKEESDTKKQSVNITNWRSWWSRPDGYTTPVKSVDKPKPEDTTPAETTPLPATTPSEELSNKILGGTANGQTAESKPDDKSAAEDENVKASNDKTDATTATDKSTQSRSWFAFWSSTQNAQANSSTDGSAEPPNKADIADVSSEPAPDKPIPEIQMSEPQENTPTAKSTPSQSSGWAFWSRAEPKSSEADTASTHKQVGELAVADTPSQSHPEAAQFNEQDTTKQKEPTKSIRGRAKAKDLSKDKKLVSVSTASTPSTSTPARSPSRASTAAAPQPAPKQAIKAKQEPPNLLLPAFHQTYSLLRQPSYWQQIREYFLGNEPATPHLHIAPTPPRIKRAIAIGVHGYFPAPLIQKVLGQPTGTSIRFANAAAAAIAEWTEQRGYECEIEKVALEGEGFIADRVTTLWNLLLNWTEQIRKADFILVACHSQGVPVAIMLVAKLIHFGCINASRVGVCAMAGVNLGPFGEYRTRYLGGTAAELFEFCRPQSIVSQMYLGALDEVLRAGVRIVYVGSIDDQLVSLESSTFTPLSHPYIYRAVFVDGRLHAPDFLTHLVGFAMKLRNLGLPDHGLIRELSPALAGSLYSGEGHSRIYEDPRVYSLAVSHALETTSIHNNSVSQRPVTPAGLQLPSTPTSSPPASQKQSKFSLGQLGQLGQLGKEKEDPLALKFKDYESPTGKEPNPYFLPWAMRGLLEEEFVKRELGDEVQELLDMFEEWRPTSKALRDVKFRLEGVRSRL